MRLLENRDFRLLWCGYTLSTFGDFVVPAALTLAVVRATGSAAAIALVLGCASVPRLILLPLGGAIADRWRPRQVAACAAWVSAAAQLVVGIELVTGVFRLVDLAVAGAVTGAASAFALPCRAPLVAATVPAGERGRANGLLGVATGVARILGPAAAGAFLITVGPGWAFLLDAATFVASALALAALRIPVAPQAGRDAAVHRDLLDGWAELRRHRWFAISLVGHAGWNMAAAVLLTLGPLVAVRHLGGEQVWVAVLQAGAVGLVGGSLLATWTGAQGQSRIRIDRPVLVANLALALYAVPLALLAMTAPVPALVAGYAVALAGLGFLNPVWETAVQRHIPSDRLARVTAYDLLVSFAAMPLGYLLAAPAAEAFGLGVPLVAAAVLVAVSTIGSAASPAVRNLRADPVDRSAGPAEPAVVRADADRCPAGSPIGPPPPRRAAPTAPVSGPAPD